MIIFFHVFFMVSSWFLHGFFMVHASSHNSRICHTFVPPAILRASTIQYNTISTHVYHCIESFNPAAPDNGIPIVAVPAAGTFVHVVAKSSWLKKLDVGVSPYPGVPV